MPKLTNVCLAAALTTFIACTEKATEHGSSLQADTYGECKRVSQRLGENESAVKHPELFPDGADKCKNAGFLLLAILKDQKASELFECADQEADAKLKTLRTTLVDRMKEKDCPVTEYEDTCVDLIVYSTTLQRLSLEVSDLMSKAAQDPSGSPSAAVLEEVCGAGEKAKELFARVETTSDTSTCKYKKVYLNDMKSLMLTIESEIELSECEEKTK